MREIKFRAWHKDKQMWMGIIAISFLDGWIDLMPAPDSSWTTNLDDVDLEQFTTLTDDNGDKIYEGDILKIAGWRDCGIVVFRSGMFAIRNNSKIQATSQWESISLCTVTNNTGLVSCRVIGNVHENPDLLTK